LDAILNYSMPHETTIAICFSAITLITIFAIVIILRAFIHRKEKHATFEARTN